MKIIPPFSLEKLPLRNILIVVQFLIIIFCIRSCSNKTEENNNNQKILLENFKGVLKDQSTKFSKEKNKLGEEISTQKEMVLQRDKKLEAELLKSSNLNQLNKQIRLESEIKINNIIANYTTPSKDTFFYITKDSIKIPCFLIGTKFSKIDNWYSITGGIEKEGVEFDSLIFHDKLTINIGKKRKLGFKGYFERKENVVEVIRANPYASTIAMNNITLKEEKPKWFETTLFKFFSGFLTGYILKTYTK